MNGKQDDRRVRKTKKALREGLAVLMEQKNIRDISVRELTDLVDIHRGTFYLHYRDIYDLQEQIENDIVSEVTQIFEEFSPVEMGDPYPMLRELLHYIMENAVMCRALLGNNAHRSFVDKLSAIMQERCMQGWVQKYRLDESCQDVQYFSRYLVSGYIAIITMWVESGMKNSPDETAELMGRIGMYGIMLFEKIPAPGNSPGL